MQMADGKIGNFILPSPNFKDEVKKSFDNFNRRLNPHFSTPNGMLLPRHEQPPPMYGPRGATVPPQYMVHHSNSRKRTHTPPFLPRGGQDLHNQRPPFFKNGGKGQQYRGPRPHGTPQNTNGLDKEVVPGLLRLDWKLWCEGCDVNCRSEEEYQSHLANHMPCSVVECKFVGHPMIMKKHMRQMHNNNQESGNKAGTGPSQEEIEHWKEERRKRFPTKTNIILRQQAQEERFKRGERIEEKKDRFPHSNEANFPPRGNAERKESVNVQGPKRPKRKKRTKAPLKVTPLGESAERVSFMGTSFLSDYKKPSNALGMLGEYGTDSENASDDTEAVGEKIVEQGSTTVENLSAGKIIEDEATREEHIDTVLSEGEIIDDNIYADNPKEESDSTLQKDSNSAVNSAIIKKIEPGMKSEKEFKKGNTQQFKMNAQHHQQEKKHTPRIGGFPQKKKTLLDYSKLRKTKPNTMLEKLLDSDVRHERNVLLQCVRHVLSNEFFRQGHTKEPDISSNIGLEK